MKILIAGGAGLIGSNLTKYHLSKNDEVTVIDNLITGQKENIQEFITNKNFIFIKNDIISYDFNNLPSFDIIYHLASPASPIQYKKHPIKTLLSNSLGTKNIYDFAIKSKSKVIIFASTSEVYGDPLEHPQKESYFGNVNSFGERSCYDESKRFGEALSYSYIQKYSLDIRIARIFNTYGPNMEKNDGRVISNFIVQALANRPITIYGNGKQTRSFCYVDDMVEALYRMATKENIEKRIINLGNPQEIEIIKIAHLIKELTQSHSKIAFLPATKDDPKKRKPDITRAKKILNWEAKIKLEEGLKKTIKYFKKRFLL